MSRLNKMKHECAIHIDENGNKSEIYPYQLEDEGIRIKYRDEELWDKTLSFFLFIRYRPGSSHFYAKGRNRKDISGRYYETEAHTNSIDNIVRFFKKKERLQLGYNEFVRKGSDPEFQAIYKIKDYNWNSGVKRVLDNEDYTIFDIIGTSSDLALTEKKPLVGIEVIDSHFPDENTFNQLRVLSSQIPFVMLFYFLIGGGKYNNMKHKTHITGIFRVKYYIEDGSFWVNDERIEDKDYSYIESYNTPADFNKPEIYYKAVIELEIDRMIRFEKEKEKQKA